MTCLLLGHRIDMRRRVAHLAITKEGKGKKTHLFPFGRTLWAHAEVATESVHAGSGVAVRPAAVVRALTLIHLQAARQAHLQGNLSSLCCRRCT